MLYRNVGLDFLVVKLFFKFVCEHHDNDSHPSIMEPAMKRGGCNGSGNFYSYQVP